MELGCTTHTCVDKTKPRNFRTSLHFTSLWQGLWRELSFSKSCDPVPHTGPSWVLPLKSHTPSWRRRCQSPTRHSSDASLCGSLGPVVKPNTQLLSTWMLWLTTDQTDKVDDFFQKSIIYGFGQFGWTKSFQKIFGHGVRQVATVLNKHFDLRPGLFWKFCSNSHEEVFGLWARKKLLRWTKSFHKILGARQVASSKQKHLGLGPGYQLKKILFQ